jgi:hypothetical protein
MRETLALEYPVAAQLSAGSGASPMIAGPEGGPSSDMQHGTRVQPAGWQGGLENLFRQAAPALGFSEAPRISCRSLDNQKSVLISRARRPIPLCFV